MVDINAKLTIEIRVENYQQVVRNRRGRFLGTVVKVPAVNSLIKKKVDETIEEETKELGAGAARAISPRTNQRTA